MTHQESSFTNPNGKHIFTQSWLPDAQIKAVVVIVHGLGEHSSRYQALVEQLISIDSAVYSLDHPGHGRSEGKRVYIEDFNEFIDTLDLLIDQIKAQHPQLPLYLIGHSMGGLISASYLLKHQDKLAGAILSAPAIQPPANLSPLLIKLGKYIAALAPKLPAVALDIQGVSRDPQVVAQYQADPLNHTGLITAGLSRQIQVAMEILAQQAHTIIIPLLILQGTADRLVNPEGAHFFKQHIASQDKELKIYDGLYHELFNEPEKDQIFADAIGWLSSQLIKHESAQI
ncbi:hypothetical protein A3K86_20135 [Photobacterium jeanii]|uniref:Monoacylglycerol lipase n=1 Tax=Photobacterium jeanii TaxID=858640 RepID=A0A178K2D3_9GAMM|nr:alpha/beta hydrolase [Photobacterium jeanii]OAN11267.1 hypothetical protein A3K86_20135 [Photobacterium jeanii]